MTKLSLFSAALHHDLKAVFRKTNTAVFFGPPLQSGMLYPLPPYDVVPRR